MCYLYCKPQTLQSHKNEFRSFTFEQEDDDDEHTYICTYVYTYIHMYECTYIHTYIHIYIHTYIHACIHTYIHICMHTYIHTCIHTYIYTYMHAYIHTYIHIYIHTNSLATASGLYAPGRACTLSRHCEPCKQSSWSRGRNLQENRPSSQQVVWAPSVPPGLLLLHEKRP